MILACPGLYLRMDFKEIWHSCSSRGVVVPFKHLFGWLKVKVTLEGQMIKWSQIVFVRAITSMFMHGFQNSFIQVFSLKSSSAV